MSTIDEFGWVHTGDKGFMSANGFLTITARQEPGGGYTSARMKSQGLQTFQYGRIDFRAKMPEGQGIWPALWMLGENINSVSWPACGEIDVMEHVGKDGYIYASYSPLFERFHRDLLPGLTQGAMTVGYEGLSIELLRHRGGTAYLPEAQIAKLQLEMPNLRVVQDAPLIQQPLYVAAHVRRRHRQLVAAGLKVVRDVAGSTLDPTLYP